ncbi:hypothetical protein C8R45DRAFT_942315 [Mycena sanguinolenta]|nr:hypothetical protein C8R45DRAFT_942315 [Mycena sanguinolenta]
MDSSFWMRIPLRAALCLFLDSLVPLEASSSSDPRMSGTSHVPALPGEAERTFVSFVADISARYVAHTTSGADDVSTAISWCSNPRVAHAVHIVTFCTLRLTSRVRVRLSWCSSPPTSTSPQAFLFVPSFTSARTAQSAHVAIMHAIRQGSRPKILQPI